MNLSSLDATPYPGSINTHGQTETLHGVKFTHWFSSVLRSSYHVVTAGQADKPVLLFLHGFPESWFAFHYQMCAFAEDFFCVAIDLKGYGQSEKSPKEEYSFAHCAFELGLLIDKLGIEEFALVTHDRGSVLGDHLCNLPNHFNRRISKFARMQQSANHPHAEPRPPHRLFSSSVAPFLFSAPGFPMTIYEARPSELPPVDKILKFFSLLESLKLPRSLRKAIFQRALRSGGRSRSSEDGAADYQLTHGHIDEQVIGRIHEEFRFAGVAEAVPLTFAMTNFDKEYEDRTNFLFDKMSMPVLFLQGELDPGQPKSDYEGLEAVRENFSLRWVAGAGHFLHLEQPESVNAALKEFLLS